MLPHSRLENRPTGHFARDAGRQVPLKKSLREGCPLGEEGRSSCRADRKKSEDKERPGRGKEDRQDNERSLAW